MSLQLLPADLTSLAERVIHENAALGRKISAAESCTGGLISAALTEISGSSAVFLAGMVTYSNAAKANLLNVSCRDLDRHGAVSAEVAEAMAKGALEAAKADIAVAVTGIAGPDGGSDAKPVGTVYFGLAKIHEGKVATESIRKNFNPSSTRAEIRLASATYALERLLP